jgi:hypothetical protein
MALITNIGLYNTLVTDNNGTQYTISPGANVTVPNADLDYTDFSDGVARGWISVVGWFAPSVSSSNPVVFPVGSNISTQSIAITPATDAMFVLAPGDSQLGRVSGNTSLVGLTIIRPADVVAYSALDTVSSSTTAPILNTFVNLGRTLTGSGYIVKARLVSNQSTLMARFRLNMYSSAPGLINDNLPFTELWDNRLIRVGHIDFDACTTEGVGSTSSSSLNSSTRLAFVCSNSRNLHCILETKDSFTPISAQNFYVELTVENN